MWKTEQKVRDFVEKHHLIRAGDLLVAGISGGADSVCLFYLLRELQKNLDFRFIAVHVNHNLRGEEAVRDEKFVEKLCESEGLPCRIVRKDVERIAREQGLTLEEAGRKARYEAFEQILAQENGTKIVLAHHKDDQAETMLHHLARGTGIGGLCALKPVYGNRIRPLLCLERMEIEQYLHKSGRTWQTDSTNLDDTYTRNKIRHHIVSYLCQEINPRTVEHMAGTAGELGEVEELLAALTAELAARTVERSSDYSIISEDLRKEPGILQRRVFLEEIKWVAGSGKDFTRTHAEDIQGLWEKQVGKQIMLPRQVTARRGYGGICIVKERKARKSPPDSGQAGRGEWEYNGGEEIVLFPGNQKKEIFTGEYIFSYQLISPQSDPSGFHAAGACGEADNNLISYKFHVIEEKKYTKWLDYDKMKDKVVIRHRNPGDRISILPSGGSKKLKDYLIDRKIPRQERDGLWLLAAGQEVLWIIGDRIGEKYKVTDTTRQILYIQIKGGTIHE